MSAKLVRVAHGFVGLLYPELKHALYRWYGERYRGQTAVYG